MLQFEGPVSKVNTPQYSDIFNLQFSHKCVFYSRPLDGHMPSHTFNSDSDQPGFLVTVLLNSDLSLLQNFIVRRPLQFLISTELIIDH